MTRRAPTAPRGLALRRRPREEPGSPFAPGLVELAPRHLVVDGEHVATLAITGYPRDVHPGWLDPLVGYSGRLDVSVHIEPVDAATAANRLRRQLARLESGRRHSAEHGRLPDPLVEAAVEDAHELSARVARGEGRLFRFGLYLAVYAADEHTLAEDVTAVRALAASLLLDAQPASYRQLAGWTSCLPLGLDALATRRTMDTAAVSAAFPFTSPDLPPANPTSPAAASGVLYGHNLASSGLVHWDRFAQDNHNSVILGRSGAGKSYLAKLELLRSLYRGIQVWVIDPEDEYTRLTEAVGGVVIAAGAPGVHINPLDLPIHTGPDGRRHAPGDALNRATLFVHTALSVLIGEPTPAQRALLDTAIATAYQRAGIVADNPASWTRSAPLMADLATALTDTGHDAAVELASRLHPFTAGAYSGLLSGPTTTTPSGHLISYSLRQLPEELLPLGTLLTLDSIWRQVSNPAQRRPRLVVVDEAWLLLQRPEGARFLARLARSARKHWAGLTVATQETADVLGTDLGRAVIANAATQVLLRQATQAIDQVAEVFDLSGGERQFLLRADQGQGLLSTGTQRVAFHAIASPAEAELVRTDPKFLATLHDSGANSGTVELPDPPPGPDERTARPAPPCSLGNADLGHRGWGDDQPTSYVDLDSPPAWALAGGSGRGASPMDYPRPPAHPNAA